MGSSNTKVEGHCDPNFEKVKEHFYKMVHEGADNHAQLCVYVEDKCVLDLFGARGSKTDDYDADKIQVNVFSLCNNKILNTRSNYCIFFR